MEASLLICSRRRPQLLEDTVNSVLQGDTLPSEIVIIDQSDQPHPSLSQRKSESGCDIRYIWSQSTGLSRGRNQALAAARYEALVFIDDDMYVDPGWLAAILAALETGGKKSVISGQVRPSQEAGSGFFAPSTKVDDAPAVYRGRMDQDVLFSGNMALYRSAIVEVGDFDERLGPGSAFPGAEDGDLGFRLLEAGYCIRYAPQAVVYHRAWRPEKEYLPLRWGYGVARGGFYAKYFSLRDRFMLGRMLRDIGRHLIGFPVLLPSNRLKAFGHLALSGGILVGATKWVLTQRISQIR
jgi:GT2 family glycosyltransferase